MITFKITATPEEASKVQGRKVEYVCKTSINHPLFGKIATWKGSLENEFFSVMFICGVLVVSVVEREMQLGHISISYAESESLSKAIDEVKGGDEATIDAVRNQYNNVTSKNEQKELKFEDIMIALDWQYVEFAKVDESDMFED